MILRSLFNRGCALRNVSVTPQVNWTLNIKFDSAKECKLLHVSSVKTKEEKAEINDNGEVGLKVIKVWENITIGEIQRAMKVNIYQFGCMLPTLKLKHSDKVTSFKELDEGLRFHGYKLEIIPEPKQKDEIKKPTVTKKSTSKPENLVKRPPVVTVMGHVDHGKTTLLDSLRNTFVVQQEFGGITQHIGAFSVQIKPGERITFIDTPGHAAFTAMRSRGADVTDIVVLVIAADDGVMEQTVESIKIASAAKVPIVVAVNKIDKPTARPIEEIKEKLLWEGIQVEDRGGDVQLVPISALKKINLDLLTDTILLQAEIMNLRADPTGEVEGVIIEAKTEKSVGNIATMIVKKGTLRREKIIVAGKAYAKVRKMIDEKGNVYEEAPPSTPVQVLGWRQLPAPGDEVFEVSTERKAKSIIQEREITHVAETVDAAKVIIEERAAEEKKKFYENKAKIKAIENFKERKVYFFEMRQKMQREAKEEEQETGPHLKIILKGDVSGSLEVLTEILAAYDKHDECKLSIVNSSVGDIKQTDLENADLFGALIYAFNVTLNDSAKQFLQTKSIDIHYHNVLYKLIDDLKDELSARIPPKDQEEVKGEAEVILNFMINVGRKKIPVAGAKCVKGQLNRDSLYKILRKDNVIYQGKLIEMKNQKTVVKVIPKGTECGLMFDSFSEKFEPGDLIVCYDMIKLGGIHLGYHEKK